MTTSDPKPDDALVERRELTPDPTNARPRREVTRANHSPSDRPESDTPKVPQKDLAEDLEVAWFEQGEHALEAAMLADPTPPPHVAAPERRMSSAPPPKPRPLPTPSRESRVGLGLVLAACAFGASVYFSLRWVADVRQANVAQQLLSPVNAPPSLQSVPPSAIRAPATAAMGTSLASPLAPHPVPSAAPSSSALSTSAAVSATVAHPPEPPSAATAPAVKTPSGVASPSVSQASNALRAATPALPTSAGVTLPPTQYPTLAARSPSAPAIATEPARSSAHVPRPNAVGSTASELHPRAPAPAVSAQTQGPRVYRAVD